MLEGFLLAPGTIDLSELMFLAVDTFSGQSPGGTEDGGNRRRASADGDFGIEGSSLDLAVFLLVSFFIGSHCSHCYLSMCKVRHGLFRITHSNKNPSQRGGPPEIIISTLHKSPRTVNQPERDAIWGSLVLDAAEL